MVISLSLAISIAITLFMWVAFLMLVIFVKVVRTFALLGAILLLLFSVAVFWFTRYVIG
jgi:hypothetical protein